tara:strand:+ start:2826 stop:4481 length:1656 start_codon:yes stop_codon:yes gene_type:complete
MSYEGSAREYRPQKFEKLIGQEHICQTLMNSLSSKTVASAYLFSGTRGVGKTTTARILAKALNCEENGKNINEPCDKCSSCHEISISSHPDVLEIDGATYTGVENVRDLQERLVYLPSKGRYKCIILDEVHMLSKGAFNALLKTLEEPPPNVVFIFATTELRRVPDTVISRCQTFEFRRISVQKISEHLSEVSKLKGRELEESVIFSISRMSEGSLRDALSLLDQILSFSEKDKIIQEDIETVLGLPPSNVYSYILTAISERNTLNSLKKLKDIYEQGHDLKLFSVGLLNYLRDLMVLKVAGKNEELFDISKGEIAEREDILSLFSFEEVHHAYNILNGTISEASTLSSPFFILEIAFLRMCNMNSISNVDELLDQIKDSKTEFKKTEPAIVPDKVDIKKKEADSLNTLEEDKDFRNIPKSSNIDWDSSKVEEAWMQVISQIRESRRVLFDNLKVDFSVSNEIKLLIDSSEDNSQFLSIIEEELSFIKEKLKEIITWDTEIILEKNGDRKIKNKKSTPNLSIENDGKDMIQEVVDLFDGKVVDIRAHEKPM